jgi:tRNA (guanine-N7-)-methyltransferase
MRTLAGETFTGPHPRRHYGRRKGWKLRPHQAGLIETLLPHLLLTPRDGFDPRTYFSFSSWPATEPAIQLSDDAAKSWMAGPSPAMTAGIADVWLEVGFGGGEHLAWQAEKNPGLGLIGAEPFVAGIAKLLAKIESANLANIRLYTEDARDILAALPPASLGRVFILFPDPWPKSRHHKRRFIQTDILDDLARVMRPSAELRFATDDAGYLVWALERLMAHSAFAWTANAAADWRTRPADWPETRYEAKAIKAGRPSTYLRFIRI